MRHGQLGATVGQIRNADFLGSFLDDVVQTTPWHGREILAVRIAGTILNRTRHTHVAFGFGEPRRNFRVVDRPIFTKTIQIRGFEIDISEPCRRASPEIRLATGCFAALPIPVCARCIGVGDIVLEQISAIAVFGLLDRVGFLMSLILEAQGVAIAAILQVIHLAMIAIVLIGIGARSGVESTNLESRFAENLHGRAAPGAGPNHDHIVPIIRQERILDGLRVRLSILTAWEGVRVPDRRDAGSRASLARLGGDPDSRCSPTRSLLCSIRPRCSPASSGKTLAHFPWPV